MRWRKRGLIYGADGSLGSWANSGALQPTPILLDERTIRVFCAFRDALGVGRVAYVDVDANDPARVLGVSSAPVLDVGEPGAFDDNGVVPTAVVRRPDGLFLYYAGYQVQRHVRFVAFCGLAISRDDGATFVRASRAPVMDRTNDELLFRVIHSVQVDGSTWRVWYGAGDHFRVSQGSMMPEYNIRYCESTDGIRFPSSGIVCLDTASPDEYRVGRPYIVRSEDGFRMFYCFSRIRIGMRLGFAESADGLHWHRRDSDLGLAPSKSGWDSQMMGYPAMVKVGERAFLFYNGNDYGALGFGFAEIEEW